jgi:predicted transglutaminase-like cysteine proteinase
MFILRVFILLIFFINIAYADTPYVDEQILKKIDKKYKIYAKKRFLALQETLDSVKNRSEMEKLEAVNNFFNDVRYASDMKIYGKKDYWATPWEFLAKDRGDCEDFVISKYFALKYLGIDYKKLFFTYVRSTRFKEPHMVLTYFKTPKSEPLILDNYNRKIFPASQREDLTPIYNFNGDLLDEADKSNKKSHKKWDELKLNMQREKI